MELLLFLLFVWCLWLSLKVMRLEERINQTDGYDTTSQTDDTSKPLDLIPATAPLQDSTTSSWLSTMWNALVQHIPRYQTSTWMALILLGVGGISLYQYLIEQGYYHPSPLGGYLVTGAITCALLWKDRMNPLNYMAASVVGVAGFSVVSHQFNTVGNIGLWAHIGLIGFLLYYPKESRHYGYLGLGIIGTIISLFFHYPPISSMIAFALWVYHFKKPFNLSLFTFFEILMALSFAHFNTNDMNTLYLSTMIASVALLASSIHLTHWKEGLYYILGMLSVFTTAIMGHTSSLFQPIPWVALEWCFGLLIPLIVVTIRSWKYSLARQVHIIYLSILTSFLLLSWIGTPVALLIQVTGFSCLIAAIWSPIKPLLALLWMGYAVFQLGTHMDTTLSIFALPSLYLIIASSFVYIWLHSSARLLSIFTIQGHPSEPHGLDTLYAVFSAALVFGFVHFWGMWYPFVIALGTYALRKELSHSLVVFTLTFASLYMPFLLPWCLLAALVWIRYQYHKGCALRFIDLVTLFGGYVILILTAYNTVVHIAFVALIALYVIFYRQGTLKNYIYGLIFSILWMYHFDTSWTPSFMQSWGWSLWTLIFMYRLRYHLERSQWNSWMWLLFGKMIVMDYALIGQSYPALYAAECLSLGIILFIMKKKLD